MTKSRIPSVIYLIRHGETTLNADGRLRGRSDISLNEVGRKQAMAISELFRNVALIRVVASPLQRAQETAEPLADVAGVDIEIHAGFIDRDYGPWTTERRNEVVTRYGALDAAPGVEPWPVLEQRVHQAFQSIVKTKHWQNTAIVAHDAVNRALLHRLLPETTGDDPACIPQRTGCWNKLERRGGRWRALVIDARPGENWHP